MQALTNSRLVRIRWALIALCLFIVTSCTVLCAHVDKPGGDDGNGHCSICLTVAAHKATVQPIAAIHLSPDFVITAIAPEPDSLIKQPRFESSLYIRPPPLS
jgi:hypothetical protein